MATPIQITEMPSEVFGFAAVVHHFRSKSVDEVMAALDECGMTAASDLIKHAMEDWQLELRSEIDGSFAEALDYYFESFEEMAEPTKQAISAAIEMRPRGRVLDIGCGAGRFLKAFADRNHQVVGIEVSRLLVWLCRNRVAADVFKKGIEDVDESLGFFDIQLLLGHNLGIGASPEGVQNVLKICAERATNQGLIVLSSIDLHKSDEDYARRRLAHNQETGALHAGQTEYWLEYGPLQSGRFPWIHVSYEEIDEWARPLGWKPVGVWHDPSEAGHWCAVMERSGTAVG